MGADIWFPKISFQFRQTDNLLVVHKSRNRKLKGEDDYKNKQQNHYKTENIPWYKTEKEIML